MWKRLSPYALFITAGLWCLCNGIMHVVVPLYALHLGFSILEISSIVAVPVLATLVVRFVGGALSDRFGERFVLQGCYALQTLASLILIWAAGFISLIVVLMVANVSRSTFWIPAQSLASQLGGGNVGKNLGRLSATNYGGTLLGQVMGGAMVATLGYPPAFVILTLLGLACTLLSFTLPPAAPKARGRSVWQITTGVGHFLRFRQTWLIISGSGAAALPQAMCASIYPLYLAYLHFGEQWIGLAVSLRALGPIATGLLLAALITPKRQQLIYAAGMLFLGLALIASGALGNYLGLSVCIIALGAAGGVMDLLYQVQAAASSQTSNRSMAMASMGMGWNLSPFFMPIIVGWMVEIWGFEKAFLVAGAFMIVIAAVTRLLFRVGGLDEYSLGRFIAKENAPT